MITIKIIEENNILKIKEDYAPVVCGNTNYQLEFELGEDWNNIKEKTAIFIAEDHKTAVDLKNNVAKMPAMPNAQFVQVFLISAENEENRLLSSSVEIKLLPTKSAESLPEFKPLSAYVSEIISNINALKNGTIEVAKSKQAEFASNVSNPNLLINGDFRVNQRGKTTYTEAGKYTVDRWKLVSGSVEVKSNGIMLNGTIVQKLEHTPSIQVVASSNAGTISYSNGAVTLSTTTATLITYAKLEVGTTATPFSPRPHAEELALCQRYYWKSTSSLGTTYYGYSLTDSTVRMTIVMPNVMRTAPTISNLYVSDIGIIGAGQQLKASSYAYQSYSSNGTVPQITYELTCQNSPSNAYIVRLIQEFSLDAEIY